MVATPRSNAPSLELVLHIRVVSPDDMTVRLVERLRAHTGVVNLVMLPEASAAERADAVQFDVASDSANSVLGELRELGLSRQSPIIIETIDATITDAPPRPAGWQPSHLGEHVPVWAVIEARIAGEASYAPSFFALLIFAGLIGACGILTDSSILIVGAMVVGPEYSAIISVALGIERGDPTTVRQGLLALFVGFAAAIVVALLFALCIRELGYASESYRRGLRPISDLISSPDLFSVVLAVVAGLVGVVSLTLSRAGALIGVFISVTTIPAAADIAVSVAFGRWREAGGSAVQLLLNVGLLIIVGAAALRAQRLIWRRWTG
ncbi:MAG TPA: DUF389 domain-containing protein [Streptosporangiaceae bacterium]|nr:DUF389 domain-containing protein [Streptosporangiaceae bacterium]